MAVPGVGMPAVEGPVVEGRAVEGPVDAAGEAGLVPALAQGWVKPIAPRLA